MWEQQWQSGRKQQEVPRPLGQKGRWKREGGCKKKRKTDCCMTLKKENVKQVHCSCTHIQNIHDCALVSANNSHKQSHYHLLSVVHLSSGFNLWCIYIWHYVHSFNTHIHLFYQTHQHLAIGSRGEKGLLWGSKTQCAGIWKISDYKSAFNLEQ